MMRIWVKRRRAHEHAYSLVGHLCSPNEVIMADAAISLSFNWAKYDDAVEDLLR